MEMDIFGDKDRLKQTTLSLHKVAAKLPPEDPARLCPDGQIQFCSDESPLQRLAAKSCAETRKVNVETDFLGNHGVAKDDNHQTAGDEVDYPTNPMGRTLPTTPSKVPMMTSTAMTTMHIAIGHKAETTFVIESVDSDTISCSHAATPPLRGDGRRPFPLRHHHDHHHLKVEREREKERAVMADDVALGQTPRGRPVERLDSKKEPNRSMNSGSSRSYNGSPILSPSRRALDC